MIKPIPVIMLTALSSQLARFAGLDSGANDFIIKPFDIKELISRIKTALEKGSSG